MLKEPFGDGTQPITPSNLVALSRNASVISSSSESEDPKGSDASVPQPIIRAPRPRPIRTFSAPRSRSPGPRSPRPPSYLTRDLSVDGQASPTRPSPSSKGRSKSRNSGVTLNDFEIGATLGEGSYSSVMVATYKRTAKQFAIKILDKKHLQRHNKARTAVAEKNALVALGSGHPGIVKLWFTFQDDWSLYFVLDLVRNGEMQALLYCMGSFSLKCSRYYAAQLLDAMAYMHSKNVIHRDLKPENLLLDDFYRLKITDFGTGKVLDGKSDGTKTYVGTAQYVAPELLLYTQTSKSSDFWAFACIVYQMIAGRFTFQGLSEYLTYEKIKRIDYTFPEGFDDSAKDVVERILVRDPDARLGVGEPGSVNDLTALRSHSFFAAINWDNLWSGPAPPLEAGLVKKEHPLASGADHNWEDVGAVWEDLVTKDDELEWAPTAQHRPPFARPLTTHLLGGDPSTIKQSDFRFPPRLTDGYTLNNHVGNNGSQKPSPPSPPDSTLSCSTTSTSPSQPSSAEEGQSANDITQYHSKTTLCSSPSISSTLRRERGRNRMPTPVQGNELGDLDILNQLDMPKDERLYFKSTVEVVTLRRRASMLLPLISLPGTPIMKPKSRYLVLTSKRLLVLKCYRSRLAKRRNGGMDDGRRTIKLELALVPDALEKGPPTVTSAELKSEREFVVNTTAKSHTYAASDAVLASKWVTVINKALSQTRESGSA